MARTCYPSRFPIETNLVSPYIPVELRRQLDNADNGQCVYCQTTEDNSGQTMTVDHIIPVSQGGQTVFENVCRACRRCNEKKRDQVTGVDPLTGISTQLFHPHLQKWREHFVWDQPAVKLIGVTSIGRATIVALDMNNPLITFARRRWVNAGWHPPSIASLR
jgi:hypothetical protein